MKLRLLFAIPVLILLVVLSLDTGSIYRSRRHLAGTSLHPELSSTRLNELKNLIAQNFIKQTDGSFISEDKTIVIKKIIDETWHKAPQWRRLLPGFATIGNKCKQQKQKTFIHQVCIKAYEFAPLETGLIYYQFEPTTYFNKCIDDLNFNQDSYYIQRIAIPSTEVLKEAPLKNAKSALTRIFDFMLQQHTCHRFKMPSDKLMHTIGFVGERPSYTHLANLTYNRARHDYATLEIQLNELRSWLADNRPELIPHYNTLLEELN